MDCGRRNSGQVLKPGATMQPKSGRQPNLKTYSWPTRLAVFLAAVLLPLQAISQELELTHPTVAGGGGVVSAGPFNLYFTVAEPAADSVAGGPFILYSGLQATFLEGAGLPDPDRIFADGFEILPMRESTFPRK